MSSTITNELTATARTSDLEVPTEIAKTNDFRSLQNHAAENTSLRDESSYEDIDWTRLKGYNIPSDDAKIDSGIWQQGYRLFQPQSGRYWWLCRRCHRTGRTKKSSAKEVLYIADRATSGPIAHLKELHKVNQEGEAISNKRKGALDRYCRREGFDQEAATENGVADSFDQYEFKAALYQ